MEHLVEKLEKEINGRNREDVIDNLEDMVAENIKEL